MASWHLNKFVYLCITKDICSLKKKKSVDLSRCDVKFKVPPQYVGEHILERPERSLSINFLVHLFLLL